MDVRAAVTAVLRFDDQTAIAVRRYDRLWSDGRWLRVHQEDLCQALGVPPMNKYQNEGGPSPERIVGLLRDVIRPPAQADDAV